MECSKCGKAFDSNNDNERIAGICGSIMGDEYIETYYYCKSCNSYTVDVYHDRFLNEEVIFVRGPLTKKEGDAIIDLIKKCPDPYDKKCRCDTHKEYFGGSLD